MIIQCKMACLYVCLALVGVMIVSCGQDGNPLSPTPLTESIPVQDSEPQQPVPGPKSEPSEVPEPELSEAKPKSKPVAPELPDPMPEPEIPETPEPELPPPPPETPKPEPRKPSRPSSSRAPQPNVVPTVSPSNISCACDDVRAGDVIVLSVEQAELAGAGHLTYHWAATPGSDPVPGNSPTPRWNPSGSGTVEITAWVTGDIGTVVFSRIVEVEAGPTPAAIVSSRPPQTQPPPAQPPPPDTSTPSPPVPTKPWGAYAYSIDQVVYGVAAGKATPSDAARAALADCESKGGWSCGSVSTFQNQCFAVAHGLVTLSDPPPASKCGGPGQFACPTNPYYQLYSSLDEQTLRAAETRVMYDCARGGGALGSGTECRVLASICQP